MIPTFKEFIAMESINYMEIEIDSSLIPRNLILESIWQSSNIKNYMYKVYPERLENKEKRHIHIAKSKHINTKTQQVSWSIDGTRHDKHSFNDKVNNDVVQQIAKKILRLDDTTVLENYDFIAESMDFSHINKFYLRSKYE